MRINQTTAFMATNKTAHLYQPGARRPYGVLEWPAMLRLLRAESAHSGFAPYDS